ncbi:MAG TPA: HTTM domain-containing protein [Kofleriaceae bacterium]|nr:HTTM domain-containing protein [Kofleriaceae bacterium]
MAKRTRRARPAGLSTAPAADVAPPADVRVVRVPPAPAAPRFWEDHTVAWTKLVVVRLVFFGLMAADAFRQLAHSARYGAGGFNVRQVAWLPLPAPHRVLMIGVYGGLSLAFGLIAQGVALPVLLPASTVLYAYAYFSSQLDSYQHHYLMALVLLLWCFVPRAPQPASPGAPRMVRSWALRLVLVQLAIVYLWAAIAKLDPLWLDGLTLKSQVAHGRVRDLIADVGFDRVAVMVVVTELTLAATIWMRRTWWIALPLGVGLHVGVELIGLEIGLFSYLVLALYLLLVPDRVYLELDRATRGAVERLRAAQVPWLVGGGVAAVLAALAFSTIPLPLGVALVIVGVVVGAVASLDAVRGERGRAGRVLAALAVAALLPFALTHLTDTVLDHYRYRAGAARRLGDEQAARASYLGMLRVDPSSEYAHYYLGGLEAEAGHFDEAIRQFEAGQRSRPRRARSFTAEARIVASRGDLARAKELVSDGLEVEPGDEEARELQRTLAAAKAQPPTTPPTTPPTPPPSPGPAGAPPTGAAGGP